MTVQSKICAYCGEIAKTDDHVIARCFFQSDSAYSPVKVPCCDTCNQSKSREDEWLRLTLATSESSGSGKHARHARGKALRSLQKAPAKGLSRKFGQSIRLVQIKTPAGIYLGSRLGYTVDLQRMCKAIEQITLGLFFHETGRRLNSAWTAIAHTNDTFSELDPELQAILSRDVVFILQKIPPKIVCPGAFHYRVALASDQSDESAWALSFYESIPFLVLTLPNDMVGPNDCS